MGSMGSNPGPTGGRLSPLSPGTALAAELLVGGGAKAQWAASTKRSGVDIPYPFSTSSADRCASSVFRFDCNDTGNGVYKPFYPNVEVLNISLQLGQLRVLNYISSSCYNYSSGKMDSSTWNLGLARTPFMLSDSGNKFTVVGCRTLAFIYQPKVGYYTSGCVSVCRQGGVTSATNGICSGIGCCQTTISNGLDFYGVWFDDRMNTSRIYSCVPCSYAVLMDSSSFSFSTSYLTSPEFNKTYDGRVPLVLDWAIRSAINFEEAKKESHVVRVQKRPQQVHKLH
ncbi:hypothetical protein E2562_017632 [Oryza meyeriana var. granulata]|uniref:Wall-associated receptor kinase galacturonan-binding domain-containing protein n=1 Tax=Oryza meyeriana var. granulata TaxID=110450 RepID=A0A6G1BXP9_9ORYZ|nr:hypothetical protein E2562_017632 [Oryza meyeriana var. granulata]